MRDLAADKGCEMTASPAEKGDIGLERVKNQGKGALFGDGREGEGSGKMDKLKSDFTLHLERETVSMGLSVGT